MPRGVYQRKKKNHKQPPEKTTARETLESAEAELRSLRGHNNRQAETITQQAKQTLLMEGKLEELRAENESFRAQGAKGQELLNEARLREEVLLEGRDLYSSLLIEEYLYHRLRTDAILRVLRQEGIEVPYHTA